MKASKQAVLDAKAKVKAEWVIVKELRNRRSNMAEMEIEIARLTEERDEARREVCNWSVGVGLKATSQAVAEERGWDCYKETL
jgi:hypothetical protein